MLPPPVPFFHGHTFIALENSGLVYFRPVEGHAIREPRSTHELLLPTATLMSVAVEPGASPGWARLCFHGDFDRVGRPDDVCLAPIAESDAEALAAHLTKWLSLPRRPKAIYPSDLVSGKLEAGEYVTVVGQQSPFPVHFEVDTFAGCYLRGPSGNSAVKREPGGRYHVTGFYSPGSNDVNMVRSRCPTIRVTHIEPEPNGPPREGVVKVPWKWAPVIRRGDVTAWLAPSQEHGYIQLEFSAQPDAETRVVAALDGLWQRVGNWGAHIAQLVLATALREPSYGAYLGPPIEPVATPSDDFPAWTAWILRDAPPLPTEMGALAQALGERIGEVMEAFKLRGLGVFATGVIAVIRGGEAAIVHRGYGKALRARAGALETLLHPDVLGQRPEFEAAIGADPGYAIHAWIPISAFDMKAAPREPLRVAVRSGDRLVFCAGKPILQALDESPAFEALLGEDPGLVVERATAKMLDEGYGIVAVDVR